MKSRALGLLLLSVVLAAPAALARVISYAPYTDRAAIPAYQRRTTQHFVLIEGSAAQTSYFVSGEGEVVQYDSSGGTGKPK